MTDLQKLLERPANILIILVAGYLACRLAYTGKDSEHRPADMLFITLVFGLIAQLGLMAVNLPLWLAGGMAIGAALAVAALWRGWGEKAAFKLLRKTRISTSNSAPTALQAVLLNDERMNVSQAHVRRKDGVQFMCEDASDFNDV